MYTLHNKNQVLKISLTLTAMWLPIVISNLFEMSISMVDLFTTDLERVLYSLL
jgi:Na+-driven multidrug efflux pump